MTQPIELKDVLHFYLGQQFVLRINNVLSPDNGKLSGQMYFGIEAYTVSTNPKDPRDKIEPLLVLRKLSSMTEEEKKHLGWSDNELKNACSQVRNKSLFTNEKVAIIEP